MKQEARIVDLLECVQKTASPGPLMLCPDHSQSLCRDHPQGSRLDHSQRLCLDHSALVSGLVSSGVAFVSAVSWSLSCVFFVTPPCALRRALAHHARVLPSAGLNGVRRER